MQEYHILKESPPETFTETGEIITTTADDACFRCVELAQDGNRYGFWVYESINSRHLNPPSAQGPLPPASAPVNIDVPFCSQSGSTLSCTMGNWDFEPTAYAFQWKLNNANVPGDLANYAVQPADVGKSATCVVTATNEQGSTTAPPSNAVVVA